jgi:hypothetical protein
MIGTAGPGQAVRITNVYDNRAALIRSAQA